MARVRVGDAGREAEPFGRGGRERDGDERVADEVLRVGERDAVPAEPLGPLGLGTTVPISGIRIVHSSMEHNESQPGFSSTCLPDTRPVAGTIHPRGVASGALGACGLAPAARLGAGTRGEPGDRPHPLPSHQHHQP